MSQIWTLTPHLISNLVSTLFFCLKKMHFKMIIFAFEMFGLQVIWMMTGGNFLAVLAPA